MAGLYDPASGPRLIGHMNAARAWHTATLLPDGSVLLLGPVGLYEPSAELYLR